MNRVILFFVLGSLSFACGKGNSNLNPVTDAVLVDLQFEVVYLACDDPDNPDCMAQPVQDATIRLFKEETEHNEVSFIGLRKTDDNGRLTFLLLPEGLYRVDVSSDFGELSVESEAFVGRTSVETIKYR